MPFSKRKGTVAYNHTEKPSGKSASQGHGINVNCTRKWIPEPASDRRSARPARMNLHVADKTQAGKTRCLPHQCEAYAFDGIKKAVVHSEDVRQPFLLSDACRLIHRPV